MSLYADRGKLPANRRQAHELCLLGIRYDLVRTVGWVGETLIVHVEDAYETADLFIRPDGSREAVLPSPHRRTEGPDIPGHRAAA